MIPWSVEIRWGKTNNKVRRLKEQVVLENVKSEDLFIEQHAFLADTITKLESYALKYQEQIDLIMNCYQETEHPDLKERFQKKLDKNFEIWNLNRIPFGSWSIEKNIY
ncbi:DgyrCDS14725 [Dimorphilus gyrociliatus]|uniref:DgyrCDS14725 n=1 Tax=Dimorphilus gyrociliatus TaxID=2664684 RepID=A0A7I8WEK5_9ANNE|nr:DgyrCDS14725 [Dimorphilus gyrociliatus]